MREWITDREPTESDAGDTFVWVQDPRAKNPYLCNYSYVNGRPWMPVETPDPHVPPKPKRREWWVERKKPAGSGLGVIAWSTPSGKRPQDYIHVREVLPNDPTPEAIEEVVALMEKCAANASWLPVRDSLDRWINKLRKKT